PEADYSRRTMGRDPAAPHPSPGTALDDVPARGWPAAEHLRPQSGGDGSDAGEDADGESVGRRAYPRTSRSLPSTHKETAAAPRDAPWTLRGARRQRSAALLLVLALVLVSVLVFILGLIRRVRGGLTAELVGPVQVLLEDRQLLVCKAANLGRLGVVPFLL